MLAEADDDKDGLLTEAQWNRVELWFQYKAFVPGNEDDLDGDFVIQSGAYKSPQVLARAQSVKEASESASLLKKMLWEVFSSPVTSSASLMDYKAVLLYLCPDKDMFLAIKKAVSITVKSVAANARMDVSQVMRIAYPLGSESGQSIQRSPLDLDAITEVVRNIYQSRKTGSEPEDTVTAEQLMYSVAGERLVTVLLHRYQLKDIFVSAKMF